MASKKEMFEQTMSVLEGYDVPVELVNKLKEILEPKSGGKSVDWDQVTRKDENGNVTLMQDSISGMWFPATSEFFYEDKSGNGVVGTDGVNLKRVSKAGYAAASKFKRALAASKEAIFNDVLDGNITPDEGKEKILELEETGPDFSDMEEFAVEVE